MFLHSRWRQSCGGQRLKSQVRHLPLSPGAVASVQQQQWPTSGLCCCCWASQLFYRKIFFFFLCLQFELKVDAPCVFVWPGVCTATCAHGWTWRDEQEREIGLGKICFCFWFGNSGAAEDSVLMSLCPDLWRWNTSSQSQALSLQLNNLLPVWCVVSFQFKAPNIVGYSCSQRIDDRSDSIDVRCKTRLVWDQSDESWKKQWTQRKWWTRSTVQTHHIQSLNSRYLHFGKIPEGAKRGGGGGGVRDEGGGHITSSSSARTTEKKSYW